MNDLEPGDIIELYYDNVHYIYEVENVYVTHSQDWSVVDPTSQPAITLTTCTPLRPVDGKYDRLIVRGYLQQSQPIEDSSALISKGSPGESSTD